MNRSAVARVLRIRRTWALATLGYLLLTVLLTYPVAWKATTHFIGDGRDGFQNTWNFWWVGKAMSERRNPYFTDFLFHPTGTTLYFHTLNPFNALLSIPLQRVAPMEVTYNLIALFTFVTSGLGMFALAGHLTGSRAAAFVAGAIFAFCPYRMGHALGHLNLMSTEWMPLYALFVLRLRAARGAGNVVLAALALTLCWFCSEHYVLFLLLWVALLFLKRAPSTDANAIEGSVRWLASFILFAALTFWHWIPLLLTKSRETFAANIHAPGVWSADLLSFFVPGELSSYGDFFRPLWERFGGNAAEGSMFAGLATLALVALGCARDRAARSWALWAFAFFLLALGPRLRVNGAALPVPLPYALLHRMPIISMSGIPQRFDAMVMMCLAVAAAFGLRSLLEAANARQRVIRTSGALLLIAVEYSCAPFPVSRLPFPRFYQQLAREPGDFAVVDMPMSAATMHLQTTHGKRLVDGYVSRAPQSALDFVRAHPVISYLSEEAPVPELSAAKVRAALAHHDIRYVITHTDHGRAFLRRAGLPVIYEAEGLVVFRVAD